MTKEDMQFNKKETYTYDEVRQMIEGAIMDRARYLGFFYKVMPRDLFDKYGKRALFAYGEDKASGEFFSTYEKGDINAMSDFLESVNGVHCTPSIGIYCVEKDGEHAIVNMDGKCALVQGWESMNFSPEEVEYLCEIASYGDFGHCHGLGLEGEWLESSAKQGCERCIYKITKEAEGRTYDL